MYLQKQEMYKYLKNDNNIKTLKNRKNSEMNWKSKCYDFEFLGTGQIIDICNSCGKMQKCSICSRCKRAKYCCKKCQEKAWQNHKYICNDIIQIIQLIKQNETIEELISLSSYFWSIQKTENFDTMLDKLLDDMREGSYLKIEYNDKFNSEKIPSYKCLKSKYAEIPVFDFNNGTMDKSYTEQLKTGCSNISSLMWWMCIDKKNKTMNGEMMAMSTLINCFRCSPNSGKRSTSIILYQNETFNTDGKYVCRETDYTIDKLLKKDFTTVNKALIYWVALIPYGFCSEKGQKFGFEVE